MERWIKFRYGEFYESIPHQMLSGSAILSFHREVDKILIPLGYYASYSVQALKRRSMLSRNVGKES